jgi:hypothetical protein
MPTLQDAFTDFLSRLNLSPGQDQQVTERKRRLVRLIQETWGPDKVIPIGSFARGTHIPPVHDVDQMVVLNKSSAVEPAAEVVLKEMNAKIAQLYPDTATRMQNRSVGIHFQDFGFDVVPALVRQQGGFRIPDVGLKKWIYTDPRKHQDFAKDRNRLTDGSAIGIVRALKVWNSNKKLDLKSFHLEVMTLNAHGKKPTSIAQGVRDALLGMAGAVKSPCGDPGLSGQRLDEYLSAQAREAIASRCQKAAEELGTAIQEDAQSRSSHAVLRVRELIGRPF